MSTLEMMIHAAAEVSEQQQRELLAMAKGMEAAVNQQGREEER